MLANVIWTIIILTGALYSPPEQSSEFDDPRFGFGSGFLTTEVRFRFFHFSSHL